MHGWGSHRHEVGSTYSGGSSPFRNPPVVAHPESNAIPIATSTGANPPPTAAVSLSESSRISLLLKTTHPPASGTGKSRYLSTGHFLRPLSHTRPSARSINIGRFLALVHRVSLESINAQHSNRCIRPDSFARSFTWNSGQPLVNDFRKRNLQCESQC